MITEIKSSSLDRNRRKIEAGLLLLILLTSATRQLLAAEAQRVITTIVPSEVVTPDASAGEVFASGNPVLLRFRTGALPKEATVEKATLRIINSKIGESPQVSIQAYFLPNDPGWNSETLQTVTKDNPKTDKFNFGAASLNSDEPSRTKPWAEWNPTVVPPALKGAGQRSNAFALLLLPSNREDKRQWYSTTAKESQNLPRLILEYTVPGRAPVVRSEGVAATHSPKKFLPDPSAGAQYGTVDVRTGDLFSYEPVFFNGLVYLITKDNQLQALPPLGGPLVWKPPVQLSEPGPHLLISESGRLYVVGEKKILVYQLNLSNPLIAATEVKTSEGKPLSNPVENLKPTLAPAVGPDGSLYFVNLQQVYGLNPDLQELWKVTLGDTLTSPVTVGPSGQFVYLTTKKQGLVAINAQTGKFGETFTNPLPNQDFTSLHAPVVIRHPDGTEKIYVAANSAGDGVLAAFDNFKTKGGTDDSGTIASVENWPSPTGLWSQPIIDQLSPADPPDSKTPNLLKKIYAVNNGTLTAIDWLYGKTTKAAAVQLGIPNGNNLAMDVDGNLLEADSRVLFGSDGTLYTADPKNANNRSLRAIVPQYKLDADSSVSISSPTNLRVGGTAAAGKTWTLSAPGSVLLGNGFTVKQGATFSVKRP